jgi:hypothetical protein
MKTPSALAPGPCIVVALDLLGLDDPSKPEGRARRAIEILDRHLNQHRARGRDEPRLIAVGHRAVYIAPLRPDGIALFQVLLALTYVQSDLISLEVLLRGAITIGHAAAIGDFAVGPALVEAERLRDELADVPRVIADPRLFLAIESNLDLRGPHHTVPQSLAFLESLLREDTDGLWFLDYLRVAATEDEEPTMRIAVLIGHGRILVPKLKAATKLDRTSRGLAWLRNYHNQTVDRLFSDSVDEAERWRLRIPATSPLVYAFPPSALKP